MIYVPYRLKNTTLTINQ